MSLHVNSDHFSPSLPPHFFLSKTGSRAASDLSFFHSSPFHSSPLSSFSQISCVEKRIDNLGENLVRKWKELSSRILYWNHLYFFSFLSSIYLSPIFRQKVWLIKFLLSYTPCFHILMNGDKEKQLETFIQKHEPHKSSTLDWSGRKTSDL